MNIQTPAELARYIKIAFSTLTALTVVLTLNGSLSPALAQDNNIGEGDTTSEDGPPAGTDTEVNAPEPEVSEVQEPSYDYGGDAGGDFSRRFLRDEDTFLITQQLEAANDLCSGMDQAYGVDCLANQYEQIAKSLPNRGDYVPIKKALIKASEELAALVRENQDPALPVIRPKSKAKSPKAKTTRALVPVRKRSIAKVKKAAVKIVEEAQTVLLRSAENSRRRKIPYTKVAAAIGSNKVLLRSA